MALCTAHSKRSGLPCKNHAVTGYKVCRFHGAGNVHKGRPGGRPRTSGRYSKYLPERLVERYEEAATDPELLAMRDDVALLDTRLADMLKRVESGESGKVWELLGSAYASLQVARNNGDGEGFAIALSEIGDAIRRGRGDYAAWSEILEILESRRRLVESERKRLVEMQQMITAERAVILITAIVEVIRQYVTDRETRNAISAAIGELVTKPAIATVSGS